MEWLLAFLADYGAALGGGAAALAIVETVFKPFRSFYALRKKPDQVALDKPTLAALVPKETGKLTVHDFIKIRREMKADLEGELVAAHEDEKAQLRGRIAELESDIANPDAALAEAEKTIADLTARLERMGNEVGGDRLAEAREALQRLDFSVADDIFAGIEARQELAVQDAARAAYGRGEVAEAEVRWRDAAEHYARAARLGPDFDKLFKAAEFASRSGNDDDALALGKEMLRVAREDVGNQDYLSYALDRVATFHQKLGRLAEAEEIFREALEIDEANVGKAHPHYATRLHNLAWVLQEQSKLEEAERLIRRVLEIDKATIGGAHPKHASVLTNYAFVLEDLGNLKEAERNFREAREVDRATLGEAHPDYATDLINLAGFLAKTGRQDEAESLFDAGLRIREAALGAEHPDTVTARRLLEAFRMGA